MNNQDWFEMISKKPFEAKLRAYKWCIKEIEYNIRMYNQTDDEFYHNEFLYQQERANWLFNHLVEENNKLTDTNQNE